MNRAGAGSIQLLSLFGIPVRVHFTFLLVVLWIGVWAASQGEPAGLALTLLLIVFGCVILHELGHALVARRFGIETREIVLYPIGGIARLAGIPGGFAELVIAAAGPLVNLAIAIGLLSVMIATGTPFEPSHQEATVALLSLTVLSNFLLFGFNLLPAFPMDGGRILRALLTFVVAEEQATRFAALVGQGLAVLMALFAFFGPGGNVVLLLIALFVFIGAGQEAAYSRTRAMLRGRTASEAMRTRFEQLAPQDSLEWAARLSLATHQRSFPVVDAWGRLSGLLDRSSLLGGLGALGRDGAVLEAMRREVEVVPPTAQLDDILRRLQAQPSETVLVVEDQRLLGTIDLDKLYQLIEVTRRL